MRASEKEKAIELNEPPIKVLIADDDPPTRILLRAAITQWGYTVVEVANGEEAWDILQQPDHPRLLIVDWLMPKLDGISLCSRIKQDSNLHTYIILLTQVTGTTNIIKGLEAGADEFLSKPFNMAELRSRLSVGARIIRFEKALSKETKVVEEFREDLAAIESALNANDAAQLELALAHFIQDNLIQRFGGEFSFDKEQDNQVTLKFKLPFKK